MSQAIPNAVRYVKNGRGGRWWAAARDNGQIHCGWRGVPGPLLHASDLAAIEALPKNLRGSTQDFNALRYTLDRPSQYLWITIQDGCLWWCTVRDGVTTNPSGESMDRGHFWLTCDRPWSCYSLGGRHLVAANLPGIVTKTAGFRATICVPDGANEVLRIIKDEEDCDVVAAAKARYDYEDAVAALIARLRPRDFELLIDLILTRDGWVRLGKLGGTMEGIDLEVENASADEIAFVQVKSIAGQAELDDYVARFRKRRERYARMFFCVHTSRGELHPPSDDPVQIWHRSRIAQLAVRHGLGPWIAAKL